MSKKTKVPVETPNKSTGQDNLRPPWPKGVSGNPSGRPALTADEKRLRKLTKLKVKEVMDILLTHSIEEIGDILKDPTTNALTYKLCEAILKEGYATMDKILDRTVGKVKDEVEVSTPRPTIVRLHDNQTLILGTEAPKDDDGTD